jgi:hypothetical protein
MWAILAETGKTETEQRKASRERNLFSLVGPGARLLVLVVE